MKPDKEARCAAIIDQIERFCQARLNDEYETYAKGLLSRISYLGRLNLMRGRPEIWAAAIVTVIARLNFLFDKSDPNAISLDAICDFFDTVKSTTGNKATAIEKACRIQMGEPGLCREEIADALTFYQTDEGFIVPLSMLKERDQVVQVTSGTYGRGKEKTMVNRPERGSAAASEPQPGQAKPSPAPAKKKKQAPEDDHQMRLFDDF